MWFRNLQIFRLTPEWAFSFDQLSERINRGVFIGCGATDRTAHGWVAPRGNPDELIFLTGGQQIVALGIEAKLLPSSVTRQYAEAKIAEIEAAQGYKPGRKQIKELREQTELELLPRAFAKRSLTYVWIDPDNRWLVVDASSSARADEVVEHLKVCLGELPLTLLATSLAPGTAMTQWLAAGEAPGRFTIDRDCELQAAVEERAAVRYVRHDLNNDEVRAHIGAGKAVTRLALTWHDRVSFVLTEQLQVKRLSFLDILKEQSEQDSDGGEDLFAANIALMTGELAQMLADLVSALGGEAE